MNNNVFYASLVFGIAFFPFAAVFYILSGRKPLTYVNHRLYRFLIFLRHGDWYEMRLRKTVEFLRLDDCPKVLEIGCGAGKFSKRLLKANANLKAIDVNEKFIDKLVKKNGDSFELCSVLDLKYKDDTFDRAVMFDVLHHVGDYKRAVSEIRRVLKPGGYAIIWEGSESLGEERVPKKLSRFILNVLDGETNAVPPSVLKNEFGALELEPYCYKIVK